MINTYIHRNENEVSKIDDQYFNPPNVNNSNLYNAMIYPFTRMVIYGTIWYQGRRMRYNLLSKRRFFFVIQVNQIVETLEINIHVNFQK